MLHQPEYWSYIWEGGANFQSGTSYTRCGDGHKTHKSSSRRNLLKISGGENHWNSAPDMGHWNSLGYRAWIQQGEMQDTNTGDTVVGDGGGAEKRNTAFSSQYCPAVVPYREKCEYTTRRCNRPRILYPKKSHSSEQVASMQKQWFLPPVSGI